MMHLDTPDARRLQRAVEQLCAAGEALTIIINHLEHDEREEDAETLRFHESRINETFASLAELRDRPRREAL